MNLSQTAQAIIRPYRDDDQVAVIEIFRQNTPSYFSPDEETHFAHYLQNEIEDYFVIEVAGQVVGSGGINYFEERTQARLSWDMIHPAWQGKALGRLLLNHRIKHLKASGDFKSIEVRTSQLVYKFYEKNGFSLLEIVEDYWAKGFHLYRMEYKKTVNGMSDSFFKNLYEKRTNI